MYYEINIALHGKHVFATAPRSVETPNELREVMDLFEDKFPESEGYNILIFHIGYDGYRENIYDQSGKYATCDLNEALKNK